MRKIHLLTAIALAVATLAVEARPDMRPEVRAVTLSTAGVALIESTGTLGAGQPLRLNVRRGDVDDFLKSFWLSDPAGGAPALRLSGPQGFEDAFGLLPIAPDDVTDPARLLNARVGAPLMVRKGVELVQGTNMGVSTRPCADGRACMVLSLLEHAGQGGIRQFPLDERLEFRFSDAEDRRVVTAALDAWRTRAGADLLEVELSAAEGEARTVQLHYLQEVPVWKTAYRAIDTDQGLRILGWMVVENTTGHDWEDIRLTLATGAVRALRAELHARSYAHRALARPEAEVASGELRARAPSAARAEMLMAAPAAPSPAPAMAAEAMAAVAVEADDGASFSRFTLTEPVSLHAGEMISLPFLDEVLDDARLLIYRGGRGAAHPLIAIDVRNPLPLRLPAGVLTLYEQGRGHAGDTVIPELPPQGREIVEFAQDRAVRVREELQAAERVAEMRIVDGVLTVIENLRRDTRYRIEAAADADRMLTVEHPRQSGWTLETPDPFETTLTAARFRVELPVGDEVVLEVVETRPRQRRVALLDLNAEALVQWVRVAPDDASRGVLEALVELRREQAAARALADRLERRETDLIEEQKRLVDILVALPQPGEATDRRRARVETLEDEIARTRAEREAERERIDALEARVRELLRNVDR